MEKQKQHPEHHSPPLSHPEIGRGIQDLHLEISHLVQTLTFQMRKPRHRPEVTVSMCTVGFLSIKERGGLNKIV